MILLLQISEATSIDGLKEFGIFAYLLGLLVIGVIGFLVKEVNKKDKQLDVLNEHIRVTDEKNLKVLTSLSYILPDLSKDHVRIENSISSVESNVKEAIKGL